MTAGDQGNQVRHVPRGRGQINALVWSILKAQDEDEIAHRVAQWYEGDEHKAGLQGLDFETSLRARDWEGAKARLEHHFGRYHPHYKPAMDILRPPASAAACCLHTGCSTPWTDSCPPSYGAVRLDQYDHIRTPSIYIIGFT